MKAKKSAMPAQCPSWLNPDARQEWARLVASGYEPTVGESSTFAAYCQNFARWLQAEKVLEEHGTEIVLRDDKGNVKSVQVSPQVGISNKALDRMLKAAERLPFRANVERTPGVQSSQRHNSEFAGALQ